MGATADNSRYAVRLRSHKPSRASHTRKTLAASKITKAK